MIDIKTDTKEKFTVISPITPVLTANMTAELENKLNGLMKSDIPHIVLNMANVSNIDEESCDFLANTQQNFYEQNFSFVICCLQPNVEKLLDEKELLEVMNITPTESEAWDIVQMEEIERELLG
jgi:anti-anti-sigma factor